MRTGIADKGTHFEITYTPTLRPSEWRKITLATTHILVPPKTLGHVVQSWCPGGCTQGLEVETQVRAVAFHMHGHGKWGRMRLIRGGVELEPLGEVDPWDESQAGYKVDRTIKPGDDIILECAFDNDKNTNLTYGEAVSQEMCVGTLSVVGKGNFRTCADHPWGFPGFTPPPQCYEGDTARVYPVPQCNMSMPRTYCPSNKVTGQYLITDAIRRKSFTEYKAATRNLCAGSGQNRVFVPALAGSCRAPTSSANADTSTSDDTRSMPISARSDDTSSSLMVAAARNAGIIQGGLDCGVGRNQFRVSWQTDCQKREITLQMEAQVSESGWLGIGLHDAGTATEKMDLPSTKMMGADIVQGSVSAPGLKDSKAVGYTSPPAKATDVAQLVSKKFENGKSAITFKRPFDSPEGVSLQEDRFVYMICAVRHSSNVYWAKHEGARASPVRVSFFGGIAESWRLASNSSHVEPEPESEPVPGPKPGPKSEPEPEPEAEPEVEPEPEPESEPEPEPESVPGSTPQPEPALTPSPTPEPLFAQKKSGKCTISITDAQTCRQAAQKMGLNPVSPEARIIKATDPRQRKVPHGCSIWYKNAKNKYLLWSPLASSQGFCSSYVACICARSTPQAAPAAVATTYGCQLHRWWWKEPAEKCEPTAGITVKRPVRCCEPHSNSKVWMVGAAGYGCSGTKTYAEAVEYCESRGLSLCKKTQLSSQCGTGCRYDSQFVWTLDSCSP